MESITAIWKNLQDLYEAFVEMPSLFIPHEITNVNS